MKSLLSLLGLVLAVFGVLVQAEENNASTTTTTSAPQSTSPVESKISTEAPGEIMHKEMLANDAANIDVPTTAEPSLGLHGITEQQLNLRFYNFICSSHFHLDCKITETLQICIKDNYVAVLGLPLSFEKDSTDLKTLQKWMRQCDRNDQMMNQEAMRIIRQRIHIQNENNWDNVFKSSSQFSGFLSVFIPISILMFFH